MKALTWLKDYWMVPLLAVAAVVAFAVGQRSGSGNRIKAELKAIDEATKYRKIEAERGHAVAKAQIETEYREQLKVFDDKQKQKVERFASDPARLVKYINRISATR